MIKSLLVVGVLGLSALATAMYTVQDPPQDFDASTAAFCTIPEYDQTKEEEMDEESPSSFSLVGEEYVFTPNPEYAPLFPPGQVPHGMAFTLGGTPTGVHPGDPLKQAKLKQSFEIQGVTCTIFNGGALLICLSVDGEEVTSHGKGSKDDGLWVGGRRLLE